MTGSGVALRVVASAVVLMVVACSRPHAATPPPHLAPSGTLRELPERPAVAVVVREGDPRGALAVAVLTAGIDDSAGATLPVAMAAVVEARLAAKGLHDVTVAATWDGYRLRALLPPEGASPLVRAIRESMLSPIPATGPEMDAVHARLAALARRPLRDPALEEAAKCADEPFATGNTEPPAAATLEQWRASSHVLRRVILGAVGDASLVDGVASSLLHEPAWPRGAVGAAPEEKAAAAGAVQVRLYDAAPEVGSGSAQATVVLHVADAGAATAAAEALGAADGPLLTRLHGLDPRLTATLRDVTATVGAGGGCLALTLALARGRDGTSLESDGYARLADVLTLVQQEAHLRLATGATTTPPAARAGDPREAAELAAWWALVARAPVVADVKHDSVVVGFGGEKAEDPEARAESLRGAIARAEEAWDTRVVESRVAVEPGQGAMYLLVASPCGTSAEGDADGGLSALAVSSLVEDARGRKVDADVSEWITSDGLGLLVRAVGRDGESSHALARRAGDIAGATLAAYGLDPGDIGRARAGLMDRLGRDEEARGFATLAAALNPGHATWDFPLGNGAALESWADAAVVSRVAAMRNGPLRVAVLANEDAAQGEVAVTSVDRWVLHAPAPRACPPANAPTPPKPGTYTSPSLNAHEAWLAFPLAHPDAASRDAARAVAAALDGHGGLLAQALSSGLASSWGAKVVGPAAAPALVVRVGSKGRALDGAVAQLRVLFDRLRQGSLTEADRTRASALLADESLATSLDPRGRLIRLWRGEAPSATVPALDMLQAFLAQAFHDDALVIVAARPATSKTP